MNNADTVIAVFTDHNAADAAVKKLTAAGFEMKNLSVVGKGYQTEEKVVGSILLGTGSSFGESVAHSGVVSGGCSSADYS